MQFRTTLSYFNTPIWKHRSLFFTTAGDVSSFVSFFLFFFLHSMPYSIIFVSERDCTPLQCFYKGCVQSNQQVALNRLMHNIHYSSTIFPYQAKETLICSAGLRNKEFEGIEHSPLCSIAVICFIQWYSRRGIRSLLNSLFTPHSTLSKLGNSRKAENFPWSSGKISVSCFAYSKLHV
jgi:hypothetical protein